MNGCETIDGRMNGRGSRHGISSRTKNRHGSSRDPSRYRTVRLSRNAHEILGKLAMRDKLTLSKVVERYLSCVAHTPAKTRLIKKITAGVYK